MKNKSYLPRGSQYPTGGRFPNSFSKLILRAEERDLIAAGENESTAVRVANKKVN
jgi:hypothetical protein